MAERKVVRRSMKVYIARFNVDLKGLFWGMTQECHIVVAARDSRQAAQLANAHQRAGIPSPLTSKDFEEIDIKMPRVVFCDGEADDV